MEFFMNKKIISILIMLTLTACAHSFPVHGDFGKGDENFIGTTVAYPMNGTGDLMITTDRGVKCNGTWTFIDRPITGAGNFECADGRKGTFNFTSESPNGMNGIGIGRTTKGQPMKFSYGENNTINTW
jgi:hypothetical protein